jgi:hypothetical protein
VQTVLAQDPQLQTYSNEEGHFITGFLIGTKLNEAKWRVSPKTLHTQVQKFIGKDFAIIPKLIKTPLSKGGGGHYFGDDTPLDLLKGYAENSHGKYIRVKGPYSYNDGTDDYYYNFDAKLRDSKAAAVLIDLGPQLWVPFSHSPHIFPTSGPDDDIREFEAIGGALVIKGAYGPQAIISKLCQGTAAQCEKSLGASQPITICEKKDTEIAEIISSLVSKSASSQHIMPDNKEGTATNTPQVTNLTVDVATPKSNATVNSQEAVTNAQAQVPKFATPEEYAESEKKRLELEKQVTELSNWKRQTTASLMFSNVKDEKQREELVKKYSKYDNLDQLKEFLAEVYPILKASEEPEAEEDEQDKPKEGEQQEAKKATTTATKSKGASLPPEPQVAVKEETAESKAASVPVNKLQEILRHMNSRGRA